MIDNEKYVLEITDTVTVYASCEEGDFRAFSTFKQFLSERIYKLNCKKINYNCNAYNTPYYDYSE